LASIYNNSPDEVFFHGVNITVMEALEISSLPNVNCRVETKKFANLDEERLYCCHRRIDLLREFLPDHDQLVYLDVDSLVRADIKPILDIKCDVVVHKRSARRKHQKTMTGVFVVNKTPVSLDLVNRWARICKSKTWFDDQITLAKCFKVMDIDHVQLPSSFIDFKFKNISEIWVGKGKRKNDNRRYVAECAKYRRLYHRMIKMDAIRIFEKKDLSSRS
jgi:hypothetical protein